MKQQKSGRSCCTESVKWVIVFIYCPRLSHIAVKMEDEDGDEVCVSTNSGLVTSLAKSLSHGDSFVRAANSATVTP